MQFSRAIPRPGFLGKIIYFSIWRWLFRSFFVWGPRSEHFEDQDIPEWEHSPTNTILDNIGGGGGGEGGWGSAATLSSQNDGLTNPSLGQGIFRGPWKQTYAAKDLGLYLFLFGHRCLVLDHCIVLIAVCQDAGVWNEWPQWQYSADWKRGRTWDWGKGGDNWWSHDPAAAASSDWWPSAPDAAAPSDWWSSPPAAAATRAATPASYASASALSENPVYNGSHGFPVLVSPAASVKALNVLLKGRCVGILSGPKV
jgi:hypothetical protein